MQLILVNRIKHFEFKCRHKQIYRDPANYGYKTMVSKCTQHMMKKNIILLKDLLGSRRIQYPNVWFQYEKMSILINWMIWLMNAIIYIIGKSKWKLTMLKQGHVPNFKLKMMIKILKLHLVMVQVYQNIRIFLQKVTF